MTCYLWSSVADPDPPDPRLFGPPGSGYGSTCQRYGSGSGSFYHHAKIVRKTLIPTILWLFWLFIFEKWCKTCLNTFALFSSKIWWNVKEFIIKSLLLIKVPNFRFLKVGDTVFSQRLDPDLPIRWIYGGLMSKVYSRYTDWPGWDPPMTGRGSSRWRDRAGSPALWQSPAFQCRSSPPLCDPATVVNQSISPSCN